MPKVTTPDDDPGTPPPDPDPVATQPEPPAAEEPEDLALRWGPWRYTGPDRIYTNVPVTVTSGDVLFWYGPPAPDGCWTATGDTPTKWPDNHRPDPAPEPATATADPVKEG